MAAIRATDGSTVSRPVSEPHEDQMAKGGRAENAWTDRPVGRPVGNESPTPCEPTANPPTPGCSSSSIVDVAGRVGRQLSRQRQPGQGRGTAPLASSAQVTTAPHERLQIRDRDAT